MFLLICSYKGKNVDLVVIMWLPANKMETTINSFTFYCSAQSSRHVYAIVFSPFFS